jgi:tRNA A37 threonylcarbamoyladenosine modification protein TsaB
MNLKIIIFQGKINLFLLGEEKIVDNVEIASDKKISQEILSQIDNLLKKNKLKLRDLKKIDFQSDIGPNFTTARIAQVTKDILTWSKNH